MNCEVVASASSGFKGSCLNARSDDKIERRGFSSYCLSSLLIIAARNQENAQT
jgi:hypothetical protein